MSRIDKIDKLRALDERPRTIVIDLDGTLTENTYPELGDWLPGAQKALRAFLDAGFQVKVHSCRLHSLEADLVTKRDVHERTAEVCKVRKLLDDAGFQAVDIVFDDKQPAVAYIDDKAIRFEGNWRRVVRKVLNG